MTLEEALAEITSLRDNITTLTTERDTLTGTVQEQSNRITSLQEHNQKLFLRIPTGKTEEVEEEIPIVSCEDFAKTLKI